MEKNKQAEIMNFTLKTYQNLLKALQDQGFSFQTFQEFLDSSSQPLRPEGEGIPLGNLAKRSHEPASNQRASVGKEKQKTIILRHDVDKLPANSLRFAQIQHELGIKGSYYFRAVPGSWDENIIKEISSLGHEIGYHYECLTTTNGNIEKGIKDFETNLNALRKLAPVSTICMHGSPASKWDSKDLWKHYNYKDYGIIAEPYFDINFDNVFYLSDTGRRWDGWKVSIRDKVPQQEQWAKDGLVFHNTMDIINAVKTNKLPEQVMFTFHPQRWTDKALPWAKELVLQNTKNVVKFFLNKMR